MLIVLWSSLVSLAVAIAVLLWRLHAVAEAAPSDPNVRWRLVVPREAAFSVAQAAEWFTSAVPYLKPDCDAVAVEIRSQDRELIFGVTAPTSWETRLRGQLAAWFPETRLERESLLVTQNVLVQPLRLDRPDIHPFRSPEADATDPLLGVLGILTQASGSCGLRITLHPKARDWQHWAPAALAALQSGSRIPPRGWLSMVGTLVRTTRTPAAGKSGSSSDAKVVAAAAKARSVVCQAQIDVWAAAAEPGASERLRTIITACASGYRTPFGNSLVPTKKSVPEFGHGPKLTLSVEELASLFHVPMSDHPLVTRETSRQVPPPVTLLQSLACSREPVTILGEALLPERTVPFGLRIEDRRLHTYVVGKTGAGKSTLLAGMLKQDLEAGRGVGLIDPHGDLAEQALALVPQERYGEVLYFNPADTDYPVAFNPLAVRSVAERPLVVSGVVGVFKKLYGESWGPRLEYFLRNALLALVETPSPSLLGLPLLLTNADYREKVLRHVRDPLVRSFFTEEFVSYDPRFRTEAIAPIINKAGQLLASPIVRHIVGQSTPGFNLREVMDRGGIFIANLASGKIGEDNAAMLGGLLVASFQLAAMSRASLPEHERRDFFLTVDEFQHFTNDAFASILAEARKFRLSLTLSHQYLAQIPSEVSDAVFGNVGSLCVFRIGAPDALPLVREVAPSFDTQDLVNLPNYRFVARPAWDGRVVPAFSALTRVAARPPMVPGLVIERSRERWSRPRAVVETEIADTWEGRG